MAYRYLQKIRPSAFGLAALLFGTPLLFSASLAHAQALPLAERIKQCTACHGEGGNSKIEKIPSLAGQPEFFILNQLFLMREGVRRIEAMASFVKELKDEDLQGLAVHFAKQTPLPTDEKVDPDLVQRGAALGDGVFAIDSFREKPNAQTAQQYLATGAYSWNAGIFLFHPARLLAEFDASAEIRESAIAALSAATRRNGEIHLDAAAFARVPSQPLDIAVMEKTSRAAVVPCNIGWADIGSWDEIWRVSPQDAGGNAVHGSAVTLDASNNLVRGDGVTVCVAGVSDLIIVATRDAVVVLPRERAQDVKKLKELAEKN